MGLSRHRSFLVGPFAFSVRKSLHVHILGNLLELLQRPVGEADFSWQNQYGNVVRFKSILGVGPPALLFRFIILLHLNKLQEDRLMVTDPKALQKIFNGYIYQRLPGLRVVEHMVNGKGIVWADGTCVYPRLCCLQ